MVGGSYPRYYWATQERGVQRSTTRPEVVGDSFRARLVTPAGRIGGGGGNRGSRPLALSAWCKRERKREREELLFALSLYVWARIGGFGRFFALWGLVGGGGSFNVSLGCTRTRLYASAQEEDAGKGLPLFLAAFALEFSRTLWIHRKDRPMRSLFLLVSGGGGGLC